MEVRFYSNCLIMRLGVVVEENQVTYESGVEPKIRYFSLDPMVLTYFSD